MDRAAELLRRHWWVVPVLAITLAGTLLRGADENQAPGAWAGVLAGLGVLALLLRLDRPELTVLINAAAVTAYFAADYPDGPVYLSTLLSAFALTTRRPPRRWLPYGGGALVAILVGLGVREAADTDLTWGLVGRMTWFVAVYCAAAAIGMAVRNRRETHDAQVRQTATEERLRMARDLHDGVGHGLAVIAMQAGVALHVLDRDPAAARRSLEAIRETSKDSLDALRVELTRLAPSTGDGAPRTPRNGLADLPPLLERVRAGGLEVNLSGDPGQVPAAVDGVGYVVVQESITNVLRHADARRARVELNRLPGALEVLVSDDGRAVAPLGSGMGIPGMRSRVAEVGGTLEAGPMPAGGFQVRALLPISEEVDR